MSKLPGGTVIWEYIEAKARQNTPASPLKWTSMIEAYGVFCGEILYHYGS